VTDLQEVWKEVLPEIKKAVSGVGVWTALNTCKPLSIEDGTIVMGLPHQDMELAGHLRIAHTKRLIETFIGDKVGQNLSLRVIEGLSQSDLETMRRRDIESKRLQEQALEKARVEYEARATWESVYEQLSKVYSSIPNKTMPQNRAKFYEEGIRILVEARKRNIDVDDLGERNFARCIERLSQYSDVPSTLVAVRIAEEVGHL